MDLQLAFQIFIRRILNNAKEDTCLNLYWQASKSTGAVEAGEQPLEERHGQDQEAGVRGVDSVMQAAL